VIDLTPFRRQAFQQLSKGRGDFPGAVWCNHIRPVLSLPSCAGAGFKIRDLCVYVIDTPIGIKDQHNADVFREDLRHVSRFKPLQMWAKTLKCLVMGDS